MDEGEATLQSKMLVLIAAISVAFIWSVTLLTLLFAIGVLIGLTAGMPGRIPMASAEMGFIFGPCGLLLVTGVVYVVIALKLRCPACGYKFLKNPKGLGPTGFVYHPECPRLPGINPWAYQIGRFLGTSRIRCINCGDEVFGKPRKVV